MEAFGMSEGRHKLPFHLSNFRIAIIWLFLAASFAALIGRLFYVQLISTDFLVGESNSRTKRSYVFEPARGIITDRNGRILAISEPVKSIYADVKTLKGEGVLEDEAKLNFIADTLDISLESLKNSLKNENRRHVRLKRYLPFEKASILSGLNLKGILIEDAYRRYYPAGEVSSQVVGILDYEGNGAFGAEYSYNGYLMPTAVKRTVHKDLSGHIIENLATENGRAGGNLMLSIDDRLQSFAYTALVREVEERQAESASAVLIEVTTGEVLVMVNVPSFDPNDRENYHSDSARNRAVTDTFEPGSTIKPFIALAALEKGVTSWKEVFDTKSFYINGKQIRDSHRMDSGTLAEILKYSSNTGMAKLAMRMDPYDMVDMLGRFGFGQRSNASIPGENGGRINADRKFWAEIDKATMGYGYGFSVTALQLAQAYAVLANYGRKIPLSLLKTHAVEEGTQVVNAAQVQKLHTVLETVVDEGTGTKAAINRYRIAGKTGTAKLVKEGGYADSYLGNFAGFAPITRPRFALVVAIRDPKVGGFYGGQVAGPVFRDIMTRALQLYNVAPDK